MDVSKQKMSNVTVQIDCASAENTADLPTTLLRAHLHMLAMS